MEKIQIVDENDKPISAATKQEAWAQGLYYRLVHIVIRDKAGNFLLQKRSMEKPLYPGLWTDAASGHVDEGESYEVAAHRELIEEIGIETLLKFEGKFLLQRQEDGKVINQFNGVFEGSIARETKLTLQPKEVSGVRWFTPEELHDKLANSPGDFTPAVLMVFKKFYQLG